jgi:probable HAF family extracellular repeat protein
LQGGGSEYAFSYSNGHMSDIGTLGIILSGFARAYAINNAGTIVGMSDYHAFSYSNGHMTDLGTLGGALGVSEALAINNAGTIVGMNSADNGPAHAFVYRNGHMTDLAPFLATVGLSGNSAANAINDHGDIAGWGITADNHNHAFLLKAPSLAVTCPPEGMIDCASNVSATIMDPEAQALTAVWRVGLTPVQTNLVPAGSSLSTNILLQMGLPAGPNLVSLEVADGTGRSALLSQ